MLKNPFHTSELIDKVRALLGHRNETDIGPLPLTNDRITALTSSMKSAFFITGYKAYFLFHSYSVFSLLSSSYTNSYTFQICLLRLLIDVPISWSTQLAKRVQSTTWLHVKTAKKFPFAIITRWSVRSLLSLFRSLIKN